MPITPIHEDVIVLGSSLPALIYAYCNGYPFICSKTVIPHRFEYFDVNLDLSKFLTRNKVNSLRSLNGIIKLGMSKPILWHKLHFLLTISSKNLMPVRPASITVEDNIIKTITPNATLSVFSFDKLVVFGEEEILGIQSQSTKQFKVFDWINVHSGMNHQLDIIESVDQFVQQIIYFYSSGRFLNGSFRDIVSVSTISAEQLQQFDFSDTGITFQTKNLMRASGIRGTRNGRDTLCPTRFKYYAIKLEHMKREFIEIREGNFLVAGNVEINFIENS